MPLPAGPWARLQIFSFNDDRNWVNTIWFHCTSTIPGGFNIQQAVDDAWTHLAVAFANPLQVLDAGVKGMRLYVNNGTYTVSADHVGPQNGNEASPEIPTEMCVVVQLRNNTAGASGRGRIFLSGVCSANTTVSDLNPTGLTLYHAIVTALTGTITLGGSPFVTALYSKKLNTITATTFIRVDAQLGQQRKRRPIF